MARRARILLVHGMRMQRHSEAQLLGDWLAVLRRGLGQTPWGRENLEQIDERNFELVFWADLFSRPPLPGAEGLGTDAIHATARQLVRWTDQLTRHDAEGRPLTRAAVLLHKQIYQAAVYMHDGPLVSPHAAAGVGGFQQVQARFAARMGDDTRLVITHSLGSVIAYEGLCLRAGSAVRRLVTLGSPMGTRHLIVEPLRARLVRLGLMAEGAPFPWPDNLEQWTNVSIQADVWIVPEPELAPVFGERIADLCVAGASTSSAWRPSPTHSFENYLRSPEALAVLARDIEHALTS